MSKLTDHLIETTSASAIQSYETKLEKPEAEKALISENLAKKPDLNQDFDTSFRTAMTFLANPWNLWTSDNPDHRKTLIKLAFAAPLPYVRNQGFRTAKTTSPFKVLAAICGGQNIMADLRGEFPNLFDDVFADLSNWEELLSSLPDFHVDQIEEDHDPPDPSPH